MDIEKLVDIITKEVMNRLSFLENTKEKVKEKLLLIGNFNEDTITSLNKCFSVVMSNDYNGEVFKHENIDEYKHIIVSNLNNKELVNISLGVFSDVKEDFLIKAMMLGKKIHFIEEGIEYKRYSATCNPNFYKLYHEYESKIKSFGINVIKEGNLVDALTNVLNGDENQIGINVVLKEEVNFKDNTMFEENSVSNEEMYINNKKLISENDLRKLYRSGVKIINVSKKCIITPLAQDFIRINCIKLNRI